jgi:cytidylate kinase
VVPSLSFAFLCFMIKTEAPVICLDGPGGVGKGTICLALARHLGWHILDSGSLYRIAALLISRRFPDQDVNSVNISQLVEISINMPVSYKQEDNVLAIYLDDENISELIRSENMGNIASQIAVIPELREALLERQRAFVQPPGLVADGRDMGTVVFPDAELKIYLTASAEERAKRRYKQLKDKGIDVNLAALVEELRQRDERDMNRKSAPLKPASDAIIIDTTKLNIEQVTNEVMYWVNQRISN